LPPVRVYSPGDNAKNHPLTSGKQLRFLQLWLVLRLTAPNNADVICTWFVRENGEG